jgi:acyl-coenzyme A thioesterase PaaI-like protein
MNQALQDKWKVQCYGCGALNEHGLQIKSHWVGDELVCRWMPQPFHIGHPGIVYGGTIASIVDCHSIWAAYSSAMRAEGLEVAGRAPPFGYVTGSLNLRFQKPVPVDHPIDLRVTVRAVEGRKTTIDCRVLSRNVECARAEVVTIRIPAPS